jgi:alpha/beta superfamily hydrolase
MADSQADDVTVTDTSFFQDDGLRLSANLYLPKDQPQAVIVYCAGLAGSKSTISTRSISTRLASRLDAVVLAFDYTGCGSSEGVKTRLDPMQRVWDVRSAVSFMLVKFPALGRRLALCAVSFGSPVGVYAASVDPRVRALVALSGFTSGRTWSRELRPYWQWLAHEDRVAADALARVLSGKSEAIHPDVIMPRDPDSATYIEKEEPTLLRPLDLASAERVIEFEPRLVASRLRGRPSLFLHCEKDALMAWPHSAELAALADGTFIKIGGGVGHHDVYHGQPFEDLSALMITWLRRTLFEPASESVMAR